MGCIAFWYTFLLLVSVRATTLLPGLRWIDVDHWPLWKTPIHGAQGAFTADDQLHVEGEARRRLRHEQNVENSEASPGQESLGPGNADDDLELGEARDDSPAAPESAQSSAPVESDPASEAESKMRQH